MNQETQVKLPKVEAVLKYIQECRNNRNSGSLQKTYVNWRNVEINEKVEECQVSFMFGSQSNSKTKGFFQMQDGSLENSQNKSSTLGHKGLDTAESSKFKYSIGEVQFGTMMPGDILSQLNTSTQNHHDHDLDKDMAIIELCCKNCSNTYCIKRYCQCFKLNKYCTNCNHPECKNNQENEEERQKAIDYILSKNPQAFMTKNKTRKNFIKKSKKDSNLIHTCNCSKSGCNNKYCVCLKEGILCSKNCKCNHRKCKNKQGDRNQKQRSVIISNDENENESDSSDYSPE
eukprot:403347003